MLDLGRRKWILVDIERIRSGLSDCTFEYRGWSSDCGIMCMFGRGSVDTIPWFLYIIYVCILIPACIITRFMKTHLRDLVSTCRTSSHTAYIDSARERERGRETQDEREREIYLHKHFHLWILSNISTNTSMSTLCAVYFISLYISL